MIEYFDRIIFGSDDRLIQMRIFEEIRFRIMQMKIMKNCDLESKK